jgi:aspartate racemase
MKTIGIIGGITWHSTADYYRQLNEMINEKLGGVHSAKIILYSAEFSEIKILTEAGNWNGLLDIISKAAVALQGAGADCILIGANTMHHIADEVQAVINIPLIHIGTVTAEAIQNKQISKVALLGTKYTMQMDFYKAKLATYGIETIIPVEKDIFYINNAIYNEFGAGIFLPETKREFLRIINELIKEGAAAVVFACTEIPILIKPEDCSVPVFDTACIHTTAAINFALAE